MQIPNFKWTAKNRIIGFLLVGVPLALILVGITPNYSISTDKAREAVSQTKLIDLMNEKAPQGNQHGSLRQAIRLDGQTATLATETNQPSYAVERKVIRKGTLDLIVATPSSALEQITNLVRRHNGYVVSSELAGSERNQRGMIVVRVPAGEFDAAREEMKKLGKKIQSEQTTAEDVSMQYAENEATLRNYRAEETSYLEIMKRSGKIKDTLEVAQELSDVRGRIERLEADIRTMNLQTEMSAIQVSVSAEPVVVAGRNWRPLYELQGAWNNGVDALAGYATAMMAVLMYLPALLAWLLTIGAGTKIAWVLLKFGARLFRTQKPQSATS